MCAAEAIFCRAMTAGKLILSEPRQLGGAHASRSEAESELDAEY